MRCVASVLPVLSYILSLLFSKLTNEMKEIQIQVDKNDQSTLEPSPYVEVSFTAAVKSSVCMLERVIVIVCLSVGLLVLSFCCLSGH